MSTDTRSRRVFRLGSLMLLIAWLSMLAVVLLQSARLGETRRLSEYGRARHERFRLADASTREQARQAVEGLLALIPPGSESRPQALRQALSFYDEAVVQNLFLDDDERSRFQRRIAELQAELEPPR